MLSQALANLIVLLLLRTEHVANRDEAAMDLAEYDEPEVEQALVQAASDPTTNATVAYSCGSSLAQIWVRQDRFPVGIIRDFSRDARFGVQEGVGGKPEWQERLKNGAV